ncbi:putative ferric-chelate reductase 1 [Gouania willdenowi]|uniref:putative ferric-chelate reductase 1 n=1 Tax=Gouania willdenowi TaxID=441366 RepID=UPI001055D16A|nr:putative ferric-chelate reductase 1 [Gouania willdenowi]XP_028290084.1 putative ferric-chelate reductase 1 [Gouania willdenowi]
MNMVVTLLLLCAPVAWCYSSGLVMDSCEDMWPHHSGLDPQTRPPPFTITSELRRSGLGEVTVQLQAAASFSFKGFLLQAREVGASTPVGSFNLTTVDSQILSCNHRHNSAVSHSSASSKTFIEVTWKPGGTKPVQFFGVFVQNYSTFWIDVESSVVNLTGEGRSSSSTPSATSTPSPTLAVTTQPSTISEKISSADCGVTKVCFSQPSNCDPAVSSDCYFMSAMVLSFSEEALRFELSGPSDGYVSFGFSDDQIMGNDDIYICGKGRTETIQVQHAFSEAKTTPQTLPLGNVSDITTTIQDGVISCSFTSMNPIYLHRSSSISRNYYLIFAYGPSSNGQILFHKGTFISTDKVNVSKPLIVPKARRPDIIKAHGALMLIAWMTTGSLGMITARYLKEIAKGQRLCGRDVWFVVHVAVMSMTVAATVIGFILSFSYVKAWSGGAHPVLGCLVLIISLLQPLLALLRCEPQHSRRFLFNWTHAITAITLKALAVAAIFTGLTLIDGSGDQWMMKVMGGFVGWEAFVYILLEALFRWRLKATDDSTRLNTRRMTVNAIIILFIMGNLSFLVALLVGIGIS